MSGHTPGPWVVREIGAHVVIETQSPPVRERYRIAEVAYSIDELEEQNDANARLMAAAPDLLTVLGEFASAAESYMKYHAEKFYPGIEPLPTGLWPAIEAARAVIAKAEGK